MRKVRVLREMPYGKVGEIWKENSGGYYSDISFGITAVNKMVKDGWLEWIEDPKTLVDKFKEKIPLNDIEIYNAMSVKNMEELAKIAMNHAVEVAEKSISIYSSCGCRKIIIEALKKECN